MISPHLPKLTEVEIRAAVIGTFIVVVVIVSSVLVGVDATKLGVHRGSLNGSYVDYGVGGWVALCLVVWIVGLPLYLITRPRYIALADRRDKPSDTGPLYGRFPFSPTPPSPPPYSMPAPPPHPRMASSPTGPGVHPSAATIDQLKDLARLRESGALTQSEFERLKTAVISAPAENNDVPSASAE